MQTLRRTCGSNNGRNGGDEGCISGGGGSGDGSRGDREIQIQ